ncbi:MAG: radical SAM family heme chaperone HemW [Lachnospiraceae bacterium]
MELYIHIPFCVRKCKYCDFLSMPSDRAAMERYVEALCREIRYCAASGLRNGTVEREIETVYFGGGTPSIIGADNLNRILCCIRENFAVKQGAETTIEINPATIDKNGLQKLYENGVNRLSIGLQSADDSELELLGRVHNYEDFLRVYTDARAVGYENLNVDLISSLPGQTVEKYLESLQKLIALEPEHISAYSLILEEGTPFYEAYAAHPELLPDEDTDREMYHQTKVKLREAGYERYEISNYARPGFESKHNSGYWKRIPYLGVGLGASSFLNHARWLNIGDLKEYLQIWEGRETWEMLPAEVEEGQKDPKNTPKCYEEYTILTPEDEMAEYFYLGLRMSEGVSVSGFYDCFGRDLSEVYGKQIKELERDGLLVTDEAGDRIRLTDYGMDVSNYVFEKFI